MVTTLVTMVPMYICSGQMLERRALKCRSEGCAACLALRDLIRIDQFEDVDECALFLRAQRTHRFIEHAVIAR